MSGDARSETYIDIVTKNRTISALLDTGCERSVCPWHLCRNAKISPVRTELYAANATSINVVGATRLFFEIQGMTVYADCYVSEDLDEFILGYDFLERYNCEWLFGQHRIVINGLSVSLRNRPARSSVRRIYVREPTVVPADTSVNVPVRMPFVNFSTPCSEWVVESREVRPGLLAARTLLSHSDQYAAVAFMNVSGVDQTLRRGHALGVVTACPDGTVHPFVQVGFTSPTDYSCNDVHSAGPENDAAELSNVCFDNCSVDVSDETEIKCASVHGVITPEPEPTH